FTGISTSLPTASVMILVWDAAGVSSTSFSTVSFSPHPVKLVRTLKASPISRMLFNFLFILFSFKARKSGLFFLFSSSFHLEGHKKGTYKRCPLHPRYLYSCMVSGKTLTLLL